MNIIAAWTPELVVAIGGVLVSIITAIASLISSMRNSAKIDTNTAHTLETQQSLAHVEKNVNGKIAEALRVAVEAAVARGVLQEKTRQEGLVSAHAQGVASAASLPVAPALEQPSV
jgi:hypothetical protein